MADNMKALMDALNNHSVTDEEGQVQEEQPEGEEVQPETKNAEELEEQPKAETPDKQETEETDEPEVAEDDTGRKYIPEKRFKEVYAKLKEAERKLQTQETPDKTEDQAPVHNNTPADTETELLLMKFPQFDPSSPEYNGKLDTVATKLYTSSFRTDKSGKTVATISKLQAAREALSLQQELAGSIQQIHSANRITKVQQADSGMASSGRSVEKPVSSMSLDEMEAHLKKTGEWDKF